MKGGRKPQSGIALGESDELAIDDWRHTVVLEQRPATNAGDLEMRHFWTVACVARNHQAAGRLSIFGRNCICDRWRIGDRIDSDVGGHHAAAQAGVAVAKGCLHLERRWSEVVGGWQ